jgi:hypothetical protein
LVGCNVSSPPGSTGGVTFDSGATPTAEGGVDGGAAQITEAGADSGPEGGTAATADGGVDSGAEGGLATAEGGADAGGTCERGVVIVTSDFKSTNIAVSSLAGVTLSPSFVSSAATKPGLTLALSGDVDVPVVPPASGRVVIIDRYGTDVLTWMNLADGSVIAQLPVGTGFESDPHDYVEVDSTRAFVTRYGTNATPGKQPFDQGGDLLIVDTSTFAITGTVPMPEDNPALQPCPDGMTWIGGDVVVNLQRLSADFSQIGDGRFVGVSPTKNAVDWTVDVTGLQDCGRVAVSPSGKLAAISCSSAENTTTNQYVPAKSDIVVYDATVAPPTELRRLGLGVTLNAGIQPSIAFASEDTILGLTYGGNATPGDASFAVNVTTGAVTPLLTESQPYVFGAVHCSPGCGDICLLSDANSNTLKRWQVADGGFAPLSDEMVDPNIGLPPRTIGGL